MRHSVAQRWLARRWFTALLFAAVLSRALIPVGFMLAPGGIVLCSGYAIDPGMPYGPQAEQTMPGMDMPGMDMAAEADPSHARVPSHRHEGVEICLFSAVTKLMAAGHVPTLAALTPFVSTLIVFPPAMAIPRGTIVPTSLPRGPPATV